MRTNRFFLITLLILILCGPALWAQTPPLPGENNPPSPASEDFQSPQSQSTNKKGKFYHSFSFLPMAVMTSASAKGIAVPLRYELAFPNFPVVLSVADSIIFFPITDVGLATYNEFRIGPRFQLTGTGVNGLYTRLSGTVGFGTYPYSFDSDLTAVNEIKNTFLYGCTLEFGYTLVLDIGFTMELGIGITYKQQTMDNISITTDLATSIAGPSLILGVGWTF